MGEVEGRGWNDEMLRLLGVQGLADVGEYVLHLPHPVNLKHKVCIVHQFKEYVIPGRSS